MSNFKDIQKKSDSEIVSFVKEQRESLRSNRFAGAGAGTHNVKAVRSARKDVARGLTELNTRKRNEAKKNT